MRTSSLLTGAFFLWFFLKFAEKLSVKRLDYDKDTIPCEQIHSGTKN